MISEEEGIKKTVVKKTVVDKVNHIMQVVIKVSLWSIFGALLGSVVAIIGDTAIERVLGKGISQTYPKSVITAALITTTLAILYGFVIGIASSTKSRKESQNKISKLINYSEHLKESEWSVVAEGLLWLSGLTVSFVLLEVFVLFIFSIDMKVSYYIAIMFFFYVLSYSRLIFYPIHLFSMICVSLRSKRDPAHAFFYLRMSSFYWDEYILLPLPGLAGGLVMVAQQNSNKRSRRLLS